MAVNDDNLDQRFDSRREKKRRTQAGMPGEDEAPLPPPIKPIEGDKQVGRNDPCPCGSGKKYKKCCSK